MKFADVLISVPVPGPFTYSTEGHTHIREGMRVRVPFRSRTVTGAVIRCHDDTPDSFGAKPVDSVIDDNPVFDSRLVALSRQIADVYLCSHGEAIHCALPGSANGTSRYEKQFQTVPRPFELTGRQRLIHESILENLGKVHLLYGVTGSGKTEVYMQLALDTIKCGRSVIFLVPEITLSSQLYRRLDSVFGGMLVVYHSGLSSNQKADHWKRFYNGDARIVVGTRSAVFMQSPDTGLIIIDEEHDPSYKENKTPRYNTRRVALMRSRDENCTVVLGSATPSVESFHAAREGHIVLHRLTERYNNACLPVIETVPMGEETSPLSNRLRSMTVDAVKRGEQAVLMLNRRGYAPIRMCGECKKRMECPDCNVSLSYHRDGFLKCHYCGFIRQDVSHCQTCGSNRMLLVGSGTQRIEDDIERLFPAFSVFRLDRDSARKKDAVREMIERLEDGSVDIVIGTQMIAKGFDFHGITLVGVLMADIGMNLPDFRARERTFSLLMQVAGRCGRGEKKGTVIIQTLDPENSVFTFLKNHDYESFYEQECEVRRLLHYPPFSRIVRIIFRGRTERTVSAAADKAGRYFTEALRGEKVDVLGPAPAPFARIASNYRYHIIIKHGVTMSVRQHIRYVQTNFRQSDIYVEIDIDPADML
ncbi:MAG: replication restart helicase PriA [Spirochaetota bacterium]